MAAKTHLSGVKITQEDAGLEIAPAGRSGGDVVDTPGC